MDIKNLPPPIISSYPPDASKVRSIVEVVCAAHNVTEADLSGGCRRPCYVYPRWLVLHLCCRTLGWSQHTTSEIVGIQRCIITHALSRIQDIIDTEPQKKTAILQWEEWVKAL